MSSVSAFLRCPNCDSEDIMKNGITRQGKQNFKCRDRGCQFAGLQSSIAEQEALCGGRKRIGPIILNTLTTPYDNLYRG